MPDTVQSNLTVARTQRSVIVLETSGAIHPIAFFRNHGPLPTTSKDLRENQTSKTRDSTEVAIKHALVFGLGFEASSIIWLVIHPIDRPVGLIGTGMSAIQFQR